MDSVKLAICCAIQMSNVAISFPLPQQCACKNRRSGFADERGRDDDGVQKMRARRTPSQQAHVTNVKITRYKLPPTQLKAHGAGLMKGNHRCRCSLCTVQRHRPAGRSQVGRPGVLTQCSLEEATE